MLAIARGLMCEPRLILMDEPSMGLAPLVVKEIAGTIRTLREEGATVRTTRVACPDRSGSPAEAVRMVATIRSWHAGPRRS